MKPLFNPGFNKINPLSERRAMLKKRTDEERKRDHERDMKQIEEWLRENEVTKCPSPYADLRNAAD